MATLELENLTKRYPGVVPVDGISLSVEHGEFVCLLGPSGCGKTTTLRMIAGFLEPDGGEIRVDGKVVSSKSAVLPPEQVEAMTMADRIVIMNAGRIEQIGTPEDVYEHPNSAFVARFIGGSNVVKVTHVADNTVELNGHRLHIGQGEFAGPGKEMSV